MLLFSNGYHALGLYQGAPRRSMLGEAPYATAAWQPYLMETLLGVTLLAFSALFFFTVVIGTTLSSRRLDKAIEMPIAEPYEPTIPVPSWLDRWGPWLYGAIFLTLASYGPMLFNLIYHLELTSPGFKVW